MRAPRLKRTGGLVRAFMARAARADAEAERFATRGAAGKFLAGLIKSHGWAAAAAAPDALSLLPKTLGIEWVEASDPPVCGRADLGIVTADYGIAATGTLVHLDTGDADRLAWTLPPVCVCFLRERTIVAEADDLVEVMSGHLRPGRKPGFAQVSFVTGPSRTADIEAELTLGVHGPGRLIILLYGA